MRNHKTNHSRRFQGRDQDRDRKHARREKQRSRGKPGHQNLTSGLNAERVTRLDVHSKSEAQLEKEILRSLSTAITNESPALIIIHGFNNGCKLARATEKILKELQAKQLFEKFQKNPDNPGETVVFLS